jgi:hypothetical protein
MKHVIVTQHRKTDEGFGPHTILMQATLDDGKLTVDGMFPRALAKSIGEIPDVNSLEGKEAEDLFYLLAGARQPAYSSIDFIGMEKDEVEQYLESNFDSKDLKRILNGLPVVSQNP